MQKRRRQQLEKFKKMQRGRLRSGKIKLFTFVEARNPEDELIYFGLVVDRLKDLRYVVCVKPLGRDIFCYPEQVTRYTRGFAKRGGDYKRGDKIQVQIASEIWKDSEIMYQDNANFVVTGISASVSYTCIRMKNGTAMHVRARRATLCFIWCKLFYRDVSKLIGKIVYDSRDERCWEF